MEHDQTTQLIQLFTSIRKQVDDVLKVLQESTKVTPVVESKPELPYKEIIDYLNEKCGTKFKYINKDTQKHIKARFKENPQLTVEDFKAVIDYKYTQWWNDGYWRGFLRPQTLFGTKFESYQQEAPKNVVDPFLKWVDVS